MSAILPPSTTRTERNLAAVGANAQALPIPFRSLWSPWTCPAHLLPYLAASWSVDRWDDNWPEATKRQVIANSYFVHSRKGTIGAIRRVVEPLGYLIRVLEWWQETPAATRGTFKLDIGVLDTGITETMYQELERLIADAKPLLLRLQTPLLRLQLVKRLAEASGFSQQEVERLCELRPVARPAPARVPRQAPSLLRPLLRLLLQKPELARELPLAALPADSAEARAVTTLCETICAAGEPVPGYALLLERLRGDENEVVLREAAADLMHQPLAEDGLDAEFAGVVERLVEAERRRAFAALQAKVGRLGVAGLTEDEKRQYVEALCVRPSPAKEH